MIDVELDCGWRIVGTTARPRGVQILDAEGNVVKGIKRVEISFDPMGYPGIRVEMFPKLESSSMDPPTDVVSTVEESS